MKTDFVQRHAVVGSGVERELWTVRLVLQPGGEFLDRPSDLRPVGHGGAQRHPALGLIGQHHHPDVERPVLHRRGDLVHDGFGQPADRLGVLLADLILQLIHRGADLHLRGCHLLFQLLDGFRRHGGAAVVVRRGVVADDRTEFCVGLLVAAVDAGQLAALDGGELAGEPDDRVLLVDVDPQPEFVGFVDDRLERFQLRPRRLHGLLAVVARLRGRLFKPLADLVNQHLPHLLRHLLDLRANRQHALLHAGDQRRRVLGGFVQHVGGLSQDRETVELADVNGVDPDSDHHRAVLQLLDGPDLGFQAPQDRSHVAGRQHRHRHRPAVDQRHRDDDRPRRIDALQHRPGHHREHAAGVGSADHRGQIINVGGQFVQRVDLDD